MMIIQIGMVNIARIVEMSEQFEARIGSFLNAIAKAVAVVAVGVAIIMIIVAKATFEICMMFVNERMIKNIRLIKGMIASLMNV